MMRNKYPIGGDARVIAEIAKKRFGGYREMFNHHGWPERDSDMMRNVQIGVAETYDNVRTFEEGFHEDRRK